MSGQNVPVLAIPPGVWRNGTPYAAGKRWHDCNFVRWIDNQLTPIGGWVKGKTFGTTGDIIRDAYSWRDNTKTPWYSIGVESKLLVTNPMIDTIYDATPAGFNWAAPPAVGYGSGLYSRYYYGTGPVPAVDAIGQWSLDNFGRLLAAVHSQDGRLLIWDPVTPSVPAAVVTNAPVDNTLVVVTDERMVMLLGGKNTPRRVKWSSREDYNDWTPTATNTAGGFELNSAGTIVAAVKVQGGILVLTNVDAHIIEYIGAPNYYGRRRISDEVGCVGKNALVAVTGGAFWLSNEGFWQYTGVVNAVPSAVDLDIIHEGDLGNPANVFMGYNGHNREVWCFYPSSGSPAPNRYVFMSLAGEPYWSMGRMNRTAWMNPIWDTKPYMYQNRVEYQHEIGSLANGASRNNDVYAITGQFEIGEGDQVMRVDRIYPDGFVTVAARTIVDPKYSLEFSLKQAPTAPERIVGPIYPENSIGYKSVRFRARSISMKVKQMSDVDWTMGKLRMRMKPGGNR